MKIVLVKPQHTPRLHLFFYTVSQGWRLISSESPTAYKDLAIGICRTCLRLWLVCCLPPTRTRAAAMQTEASTPIHLLLHLKMTCLCFTLHNNVTLSVPVGDRMMITVTVRNLERPCSATGVSSRGQSGNHSVCRGVCVCVLKGTFTLPLFGPNQRTTVWWIESAPRLWWGPNKGTLVCICTDSKLGFRSPCEPQRGSSQYECE